MLRDAFPTGTTYETGLPVLTTSRLMLRPLTAADDAALVTLFSDERSLATWVPSPGPFDAPAYRAALATGYGAQSLFIWGLFVRATDALVGVGILTRWAPHHRRVDLGYYLASDVWGRGYATEAARALVAFAFETLGVWRIEAETTPANEPSKAVMRRLGFQFEARLEDRLVDPEGPVDSDLFRLLRPEWEASGPATQKTP